MIRKGWLFMVFLCFGSHQLFAQTTQFFDEADAFLKSYVSEGKVDYKAIQMHPELLHSVLAKASKLVVSTSEAKTYQAFWINAYNLAVIKGVVDNYPLNSPLDSKGFFDEVTYSLGGENITLNDIENKKLRAIFGDARYHFVLVCGAIGCPPLLAKAYRPSNLHNFLEEQTIKALNNSSFIRVSGDEVLLSEIFKWYKEDFVKNGSTEIKFLNTYRKEKIAVQSKLSYYPYDWRLNSK
jgi:hypothetical protein